MTQLSFLKTEPAPAEPFHWIATREAGLARLEDFIPRAGKAYAKTRNYVFGPADRSNISCLSPWIRHRLVLEEEVIAATLRHHAYSSAEKFLAEVFWRGYFKGWLEHHPTVWAAYQADTLALIDRLSADRDLGDRYVAATSGNSGIDCLDAWSRELTETGYLHNHARMWFASIWIFTLRLPWQLGADFFMRHLLDADPASNTLSWRWVGGLHTKGKTYLARASNIAEFTNGRFDPQNRLAQDAEPLREAATHHQQPLRSVSPQPMIREPFALLLTEEDGMTENLPLPGQPTAIAGIIATAGRSPLPVPAPVSERARAFATAAVDDAMIRTAARFDVREQPHPVINAAHDDISFELKAFAEASGVKTIVTAAPAIGPVASALAAASPTLREAGVDLIEIRRGYDEAVWPHTTKGFFKLKDKIPKIIEKLALLS